MNDEEYYKLGAQVQALELIVKTMIAIQFAASVKTETGFGGAVDMARQVAERLRAHVQVLAERADPATRETALFQLVQAEMAATTVATASTSRATARPAFMRAPTSKAV